MSLAAKKILYVRLPVWKIYPGGIVHVADWVHKQRPEVEQSLFDMALIPVEQCMEELRKRLVQEKPDVVAFSWRNMQTFGPHPENDALEVVMNYDYATNPFKKVKAAVQATGIIYEYISMRLRNFAFMKMVRKLLPDTRIVVGGTAVSIFGKYVAEKCPTNTVVVVGEGEKAMVSIVDGFNNPEGHYYYKNEQGKIHHQHAEENFDLKQLTAVDFPYIETIFPEFLEYTKDGFIGVHTKRGCPFKCSFCIYNKIEGVRQRLRDPEEVGKEIEMLNKRYGVKKIWFTDAQFASTRRSMEHVDKILDSMIKREVKVEWTGYLRLNFLTAPIAKKMIDTGLCSVDLSFTGTQEIINKMSLGYKLKQQMEAFDLFRQGGHIDQKIKLYMPINAPGETKQTLMATINKINELYEMFGRDNVLPFIFFVGVQPGTPIEKELIDSGYLNKNYNPLSLWPFTIKRLLYNPEPLGSLVGRAYLQAIKEFDPAGEYIGRATMEIIERQLLEEGVVAHEIETSTESNIVEIIAVDVDVDEESRKVPLKRA